MLREKDYKEIYEKQLSRSRNSYYKKKELILSKKREDYQENKTEICKKNLEYYYRQELTHCPVCDKDYRNFKVHTQSKKHTSNLESI